MRIISKKLKWFIVVFLLIGLIIGLVTIINLKQCRKEVEVYNHRLEWWLNYIDWNTDRLKYNGKGIKIAVLDTGVNSAHPDIKHSIKSEFTVINQKSKNSDDLAHGTGVVGIISGSPNNKRGVLGVATGSEIISVDITDEDEDKNMTIEEAKDILNDIAEKEPIDADTVSKDANKLEGIDKLHELNDESKLHLQTSTTLGNSFTDNDKFVYFYKKGKASGPSTTYKYSCADSKSGYSQIGSINMLIYAVKIKTIKNTTYDTIYSTCTVSGLNGKHVNKFNVSLAVNNDKENKIIDYTSPDGPDNSISGSISTQVNSSGSVSASSSQSYTYNPNKLTSINTIAGNKYTKTWECSAIRSNNPANKSWTVKPAIVLKKTNGTKEYAKCTLYVNYFQVAGIRTYTIKDKVYCNLSFKNHKKASWR